MERPRGEQQAALALHRTRDLLVKQRTQLVNMIRAQLAEFAIVLAKGIQHALQLVGRLLDGRPFGMGRNGAKEPGLRWHQTGHRVRCGTCPMLGIALRTAPARMAGLMP